MDTSTISPHPLNAEQLPGYGSSLGTYIEENNQGDDERGFEHPLLSDMGAGPMLPVREYTMMEFMDQVTDKERWEEKVWDEEIVGKWKGETVGKEALDFSEGMFEWVSPFLEFSLCFICDFLHSRGSCFLSLRCVCFGNTCSRIIMWGGEIRQLVVTQCSFLIS